MRLPYFPALLINSNFLTNQLLASNRLKYSLNPKEIFPIVQKPGTQIGKYHQIPGILPACHDTASAVVAVPSNTQDHAFLSSGTWSLLGLELEELILSDQALEANLTNEGGFGGTNRFLQNIAGLWLVQ